MPSKRASRGRRKGGKGSSGTIQCVNCAGTVPKDKAKKVTSRLSLVEHQLAKEYVHKEHILQHQKLQNGIVYLVQFTLRF